MVLPNQGTKAWSTLLKVRMLNHYTTEVVSDIKAIPLQMQTSWWAMVLRPKTSKSLFGPVNFSVFITLSKVDHAFVPWLGKTIIGNSRLIMLSYSPLWLITHGTTDREILIVMNYSSPIWLALLNLEDLLFSVIYILLTVKWTNNNLVLPIVGDPHLIPLRYSPLWVTNSEFRSC
jgi:hypothetical protein